ncbi:hypothetical protein LTR62_000304 [Meristemomyces frigidus]|uniref:Uncharacterized protein n=1 Tax=Meristemomyces frigidus TaxID=1508187 RepID=A0AAN7TIS2_9PEZI|nr:hypothetical protein LTR62_000304 [Meristemomyces frigidus]
MSLKRLATNPPHTAARPRRDSPKRTKLSPSSDDAASNSSSGPSSYSMLESSPAGSETRDKCNSINSTPTEPSSSEDDEDSESTLSDSSSDPSSSDDDEEEDTDEVVVTLGAPRRRPIKPDQAFAQEAGALQARLKALLPRLRDENQKLLEVGTEGQSMELGDEEEEEEGYIEMSLGLGVLEEKVEEEDSSGSEEGGDLAMSTGAVQSVGKEREGRVLETLMGRGRGNREIGIEEVL